MDFTQMERRQVCVGGSRPDGPERPSLSLLNAHSQPNELPYADEHQEDDEEPETVSNKHSRKHPKLLPRAKGDRKKSFFRGLNSGHRQRIANLHAELAIPPAGVRCFAHMHNLPHLFGLIASCVIE